MRREFDYTKADAQGTALAPLPRDQFDSKRYGSYASSLDERCRDFWKSGSGVAVYRRFRVPEVFSWGSRDARRSMEWQLAALQSSMDFMADIPNFFEPWYGIGTISSAFGVEYLWEDGQAPAVRPPFTTARQALDAAVRDVAETPVGREILNRIELFLEATDGRVPISLCDVQSPLNIASSYVLGASEFMFEMFDHPDDLERLMKRIVELESRFLRRQWDLVGDSLALPGHGFASSREFSGVGFSDDNIMMFGDADYQKYGAPHMAGTARPFGPPVFHSCGNWSGRTQTVLSIPGLVMADAAVGPETDPDPNDGNVLGEEFADTGVILHVRIVGDANSVSHYVKQIWRPGLKLIVATYCESPNEQETAYRRIHRICRDR